MPDLHGKANVSATLRAAAAIVTCDPLPWVARYNTKHGPPRVSAAAARYEVALRSRFEKVHARHLAYNLTFTNATFPTVAFIHIPKTGGTAVEALGASFNVYWGRNYDWLRLRLSTFPGSPGSFQLPRGTPCTAGSPACCQWWHVPPKHMMERDPRQYLRAPVQFCVVREPLERMGSVWAETLPLSAGRHWCQMRANATLMRLTVHRMLQGRNVTSMREREMHACHLVPQSEYIAETHVVMDAQQRSESAPCSSGSNGTSGRGGGGSGSRRVVHVPAAPGCNVLLDFANLQADFTAFVRWLGLTREQVAEATDAHWELPRTRDWDRTFNCRRLPSYRDMFDEETAALVRDVYAEDVALYAHVRGTGPRPAGGRTTTCSLSQVNGRTWAPTMPLISLIEEAGAVTKSPSETADEKMAIAKAAEALLAQARQTS